MMKKFKRAKVKDIDEYNEKHPYKAMKRMGILIDNLDSILVEDLEETEEMKECVKTLPGVDPKLIIESEEIKKCLSNLTRLSRVVGVNMIYVNQSEKNIPKDISNSISVKIKTNTDGNNSLNLGNTIVKFTTKE